MEKRSISRENVEMMRAVRRFNTMPADMKNMKPALLFKRNVTHIGLKGEWETRSEFGGCSLFSACLSMLARQVGG